MKIDFNEGDLIREVLNFKIADKTLLEEKYGIKNLDYIFEGINEFLNGNNTGIMHKTGNYLYYFGKYDEKIFKIEDKEIYQKMNFRRQLIYIILLFGKQRLNIYRFNRQVTRGHRDIRKNIRNDLERMLENFNVSYSEYVNSEDVEKLLNERNRDIKERRERYLKEILLRRLEKTHIGKSTYQENLYFGVLQDMLKIKDIRYIHKLFFTYIRNFTKIVSLSEKYELLAYMLLNLGNRDIRCRALLKREKSNEDFFLMMDKIFKKEKLEVNGNLVTALYKKLNKQRQDAGTVINSINIEFMLKRNTGIHKIRAEKAESENIQVYDIAESSIDFEDGRNLSTRHIVQRSISTDRLPKIPTLILFDLEGDEIPKIYSRITKFFNFIDIVETGRLDTFKKSIAGNSRSYEQIIVVSASKFANVIKNLSDMPIFHLEVESGKGALKNRADFIKRMIHIRTMMIQYTEFKSERIVFNKKRRRKIVKK